MCGLCHYALGVPIYWSSSISAIAPVDDLRASFAASFAARAPMFSMRTTPPPTHHFSVHSSATNASLWLMVITPPRNCCNALVSAASNALSM